LSGPITAVGMFVGTTTAYGVYDMNGNAWSWLETPMDPFDIGATNVRGGTWDSGWNPVTNFSRTFRIGAGNADSNPNIGIRLGTVPEPASFAMALAGLAYGGYSMWR